MKRNKQQKKTSLAFSNLNKVFVFLFIFLLPTQFGKHFFLPFSYLSGVRVDYLAPTLYLTDIFVLVLLLLNYKTVLEFFKNKTLWAFLFLLMFPVGFALIPQIAIYRYMKIVELLIVFAIFSKGKLNIKSIFYGIFSATFLQALLVVLQLINKHSLQGLFYFFGERYLNLSAPGIAKASLQGVELLRPYGTFSHPNSLAGFFLLIYALFTGSKIKVNPLIKNSLLFLSLFIIFFSFSKVAILVFLIINLFYLSKEFIKSSCRFCLISRLIVFLLMFFVFFSAQTDPLSLVKRTGLLQNSIEIISKYFISGVGLGNYLVAQNSLIHVRFAFPAQPVHNIFLLFLSEVGIFLGSSIIILLLVKFKKHLTNLLLSSCFLVILLTGLFDHYWLTLQQNWLLLAVVFGLLTNSSGLLRHSD